MWRLLAITILAAACGGSEPLCRSVQALCSDDSCQSYTECFFDGQWERQ